MWVGFCVGVWYRAGTASYQDCSGNESSETGELSIYAGAEPERRGINRMFFVSQIQNTFHVLTVILKYDLQD